MFGRLTDAQLEQLRAMLDVTVTDSNAAALFFRAQITMWRDEIADELARRATREPEPYKPRPTSEYLRDDAHAASKLKG